jgi:Uma2 family endonuclease
MVVPTQRITVEEYLAGEQRSEIRHEYIDGQVYAMAGASDHHGLIVEVLSETTERIDRREKLPAYRTLPSLREYLLVAQDVRRVEIYRRSLDWNPEYHADGALRLDCLDIELNVDDIYADVE